MVKYLLGFPLLGFFLFVTYLAPFQVLSFVGLLVLIMTLAILCLWLIEEVDFCDNEDEEED